MKVKVLLIVVFTMGLLASCKSKKTVTYSPPKKEVPRSIETQKEIEVIEIEKDIRIPQISTTEEYITYFKDAAMNEMRIYKIPASIKLAQGILESSSGTSDLTKRSNNHFGIKCHTGWEGEKTYHDDDEKGECFRVYENPATSYRDHSLFLAFRTRYGKLFKLPEGDYVSWAKGLSEAGYATDKSYPAKLIGLIERYELFKFDTEVLGKPFEINKEIEEQILAEEKISSENNVSGKHQVLAGETLFSISRKYNISVEALKTFNNLESNDIKIGEWLQVAATTANTKTPNVNNSSHIVNQGETLYSISKMYGISVETLKSLNNLNSNAISIGQSLLVK